MDHPNGIFGIRTMIARISFNPQNCGIVIFSKNKEQRSTEWKKLNGQNDKIKIDEKE